MDEGSQRTQLSPFMMNYAEKTISSDSKDLFNLKIAEFYEEMLRGYYNADRKMVCPREILSEQNNNIRICFLRLIAKDQKNKIHVDPSTF